MARSLHPMNDWWIRRRNCALLAGLLPAIAAGCGGGSGNAATESGPSSSTPTVSSVAVTCSSMTLAPNATSECAATVQGTGSYSSAVSWAVSMGAINARGLFTAPATSGTATVTATSTENTARSRNAAIKEEFQTPLSEQVVVGV